MIIHDLIIARKDILKLSLILFWNYNVYVLNLAPMKIINNYRTNVRKYITIETPLTFI